MVRCVECAMNVVEVVLVEEVGKSIGVYNVIEIADDYDLFLGLKAFLYEETLVSEEQEAWAVGKLELEEVSVLLGICRRS